MSDLQRAHYGLHLACSCLVAAAGACRNASTPASTQAAAELEGLHARVVALLEDLNHSAAYQAQQHPPST